MTRAHIRIGTRGSQLALIQTQMVAEALTKLEPDLVIETVIIETKGDRDQAPIPLDIVGKSWFTAEIEAALTSLEIDMAVHSLKDLSLETSSDITTRIILERADPRDVLISNSGKTLAGLAPGSVVGTDSTRRLALIEHLRPDLTVKSLRGNVITRLRKLSENGYDAVILAAAGLERLALSARVTEFLDPTQFIPSVGQGALAVQTRADDESLVHMLTQLEHQPTVIATLAERAFSEAIGGGCKLPIACYVQPQRDSVRIDAMIAELNGPGIMFESVHAPVDEAVNTSRALAERMAKDCSFMFTLGNL
jgi:hydroxymethylbilane synthase